jgi:hypothetical protein
VVPVQVDLIPLLTGLVVAAGGGAGIAKLIDGLLKIRAGMSARETDRKVDIVKQRDAALSREQRAWEERDDEAEKRRQVQEWAAKLQRKLIVAGIPDDEIPEEPVLERTLTKLQLKELREQEKNP